MSDTPSISVPARMMRSFQFACELRLIEIRKVPTHADHVAREFRFTLSSTCPFHVPQLSHNTAIVTTSPNVVKLMPFKYASALVLAASSLAANSAAFARAHSGVEAIYSGPESMNTCALFADGFIQCWGTDNYTKLASPTFIGRHPSISMGYSFACAVVDDGKVVCWGLNNVGQLGNASMGGLEGHPPAPVLISALPVTGFVAVAAGGRHACAQKGEGAVFCWGSNSDGQLGNYNIPLDSNWDSPIQVVQYDMMTNPALQVVVKISAGADYSCAEQVDGTVSCWGSNKYAMLGTGVPDSILATKYPVKLVDAYSIVPLSTTSGDEHSCTVTTLLGNSVASCWGFNSSYQIGNTSGESYWSGFSNPSPSIVTTDGSSALVGVASVAAGGNTSCALLDADKSVWCWGENGAGQCGNGHESINEFASAVKTDSGEQLKHVLQLAASYGHTCVLTQDRSVSCWGENSYGELGVGDKDDKIVATRVVVLDPPIFTDDLEGDDH